MDIVSITELNKECDKLLTDLYKGGILQCTDGDDEFEAEYVAANRMLNDGYVVMFGKVEENRTFMLRITPSGIGFVATGGYTGKYRQEVQNAKRHRRDYWITTCIAVVAVIIAAIALYRGL